MKIAVLRLPGANCDQDALYSLREDLGLETEYVWHEATSLAGYDGVFVPGGFSYGDYLRPGAIAARAPIMDEVRRFAAEGRPVIGVCNGFQVLCEAGLLPGALMGNSSEKFISRDVLLRAVNRQSPWTRGAEGVLRMPIANGGGRYLCDEETLREIEGEGRVAFRYVDAAGEASQEGNPNGSINNIAGLLNPAGNVLGMMPHPERSTKPLLGGTDGLAILQGMKAVAGA